MKFIHCADVHLDSPFTSLDVVNAEKRRLSLRSAFASLILYAKTSGCELFVISGVLFDDECITKDTSLEIIRHMESIPTCRFVITPGNHDPYNASSPYMLLDWPKNVYIFKSPEISHFDFPEINTTVYGFAFTSDTVTNSVLEGFHVKDESRINILALHCDLDVKDSYYCPVTHRQLSDSGADYAALGHIHKGTDILSEGNVKYAYSGCLEGRSFGETGIKGAVCGEIEKGNVSLKRVRFCSKRYEKIDIDVTGAQSITDCTDKIIKAGSEYSDDTMLRITFTGITSEGFTADTNLVKKMLPNVFYLEIADETAPLLNLNSLKEDKTLAGEFYRCLEEKLLSEDEEMRKTANNALKYGLRAIKGMEIGLED